MIIKKNIRTVRKHKKKSLNPKIKPSDPEIRQIEISSIINGIDLVVRMNKRTVFDSHKNKQIPIDLYKNSYILGFKGCLSPPPPRYERVLGSLHIFRP